MYKKIKDEAKDSRDGGRGARDDTCLGRCTFHKVFMDGLLT